MYRILIKNIGYRHCQQHFSCEKLTDHTYCIESMIVKPFIIFGSP